MSTVLRLSACLLMSIAVAACNKSEPAAPSNTADASAAPAEAPTQADSATPAPAADAPVALDMDKVRTYVQALKNLGAAQKANPAMGDTAQNVSEEDTVQYAARLEADPQIRAAIEAAGLSTAEFVRIGDTLISAMMAQGALEAGQLKTLPEGMDPAAVEFVKQHKAELQALMTGA